MTLANDLVAQIVGLVAADDLWHEVRDLPFTQATKDVWLGLDAGASVCVSVTESQPTTRILCESFEFPDIPVADTPAVSAALITGNVHITTATRFRRRITLAVDAGSNRYRADALLGGRELTEWERVHLVEGQP